MSDNAKEIMAKLQAPFPPDQIEWRAQSCGVSNGAPWVMVLAYIQARAIQNRLDEVFGWNNWFDEYRQLGTDVLCKLTVNFDGQMVWKENGASNTDIEAFKGGISGAFKRVAASGYGIGRYFYNLTEGFAECTLIKQKGPEWHTAKTKDKKDTIYWKEPTLPAWALPGGTGQPSVQAGTSRQASTPPKTTPPPTGQSEAPASMGGAEYDSMGTQEELKDNPFVTEKPVSKAQLGKIAILCGGKLINEEQGKEIIRERYQKTTCGDLTMKEASDLIRHLSD